MYGNEKEVGDEIKEKIEENVVKSEDMLIKRKMWKKLNRKELVDNEIKKNMSELSLE